MVSVAAPAACGLAFAIAGPGLAGPVSERRATNDCLDPAARKQKRLRCPDLRMRPPFDLDLDRTHRGVPILRAANSIDSVGGSR